MLTPQANNCLGIRIRPPSGILWINDAVRIVVNVLLELLITPVIKGVSEKKAASVATTIVNWCTGQG
jgi:hypothetical protein